jgi:hypothetical protein
VRSTINLKEFTGSMFKIGKTKAKTNINTGSYAKTKGKKRKRLRQNREVSGLKR